MLQADNDPEAESRLGNLDELVNAASEAAERGETIAEFLDHAALVADSDGLDERAPVSLLTLHNAKGSNSRSCSWPGWKKGCFRMFARSIRKRPWKRNGVCATSA